VANFFGAIMLVCSITVFVLCFKKLHFTILFYYYYFISILIHCAVCTVSYCIVMDIRLFGVRGDAPLIKKWLTLARWPLGSICFIINGWNLLPGTLSIHAWGHASKELWPLLLECVPLRMCICRLHHNEYNDHALVWQARLRASNTARKYEGERFHCREFVTAGHYRERSRRRRRRQRTSHCRVSQLISS